jgi:hypothetical protein
VERIAGQVRTAANPRTLLYETEKLRSGRGRVLEGVERLATAEPADERASELQRSTGQAARRLALGFAAAAALLATAITAGSAHAAGWTTPLLGVLAGALTCLLAGDVLLRR